MSPLFMRSPATRRRAYPFLWCLGMLLPGAASADFEEVRVLRTEPFQVQTCPPTGQVVQAPQPTPHQAQQAQQTHQQQQNPPAQGITGREIPGGVAGAAVGGLL